jgi:hypothetical protein
MPTQHSDPSFRGYKPLYKNSFPAKLVEAIDAGGRKTRSGWARHFHKSTMQISIAMNSLRKHGRQIFPIGGKNIWPQEEGILTDITLLPEDVRETVLRTKKTYLSPQLKSSFRIQEDVILKHPEMYDELESSLTETLTQLLIAKENFKAYGHKKLTGGKN